jgi:hypothetical protein
MEAAEDPLATARGIGNGLCISFFLWAMALLLTGPVNLLSL